MTGTFMVRFNGTQRGPFWVGHVGMEATTYTLAACAHSPTPLGHSKLELSFLQTNRNPDPPTGDRNVAPANDGGDFGIVFEDYLDASNPTYQTASGTAHVETFDLSHDPDEGAMKGTASIVTEEGHTVEVSWDLTW